MTILNAWIRNIQIIFTSSLLKKQLIFDCKDQHHSLNIDVSGNKYLSGAKDSFVIKISNLSYKEIIQLIKGQYYDIEIKAGYKSKNVDTIFKGSVIYISNSKESITTNTCIILAGNKLVAKYGQTKLNFSFNSSINMYSAIDFLCKKANIKNTNLDPSLKYKILQNGSSTQGSIENFLETISKENNLVLNADASYNSIASLFDINKSNTRIIKLNKDNTVLINGYPKLNSEGLSMTLLPLFNFMPGDIIEIDNSLIDISTSSTDSKNFNNSAFLDNDGQYVIMSIKYSLQNRSDTFSIDIVAKAKSLFNRGDYK